MTPEEKPVLTMPSGERFEVDKPKLIEAGDLTLGIWGVEVAQSNYAAYWSPILRRLPDTPSPEYEKEKVCDLIEAAKVLAADGVKFCIPSQHAALVSALKALEPEPEKRYHNEGNIVYDREAGNYDRGTFYADDTENAIAFAAALNNLHESKGEVK